METEALRGPGYGGVPGGTSSKHRPMGNEGIRLKANWCGSKDFWSGMIFLGAGVAFVGFGRHYPMGTTMRMGPGYFPIVLGGLLALIGLSLILRALLQPGPAVGRMACGKLALVTLSNVLFALLLRRLGLAAALILLVVVSAYASKRFRWPVALTLAVGLAVGSSIIFVWLLGLPIPIRGTWLGG
jgi:hypothetical protein